MHCQHESLWNVLCIPGKSGVFKNVIEASTNFRRCWDMILHLLSISSCFLSIIIQKYAFSLFCCPKYLDLDWDMNHSHHEYVHMESWHWKVFHVAGSLWGDSTGYNIPRKGSLMPSFDIFFLLIPLSGLINSRVAGDLRRHGTDVLGSDYLFSGTGSI